MGHGKRSFMQYYYCNSFPASPNCVANDFHSNSGSYILNSFMSCGNSFHL